MDFHRGQVRKQPTFDARLFIHMIGLILYGEMQSRLKVSKEAVKRFRGKLLDKFREGRGRNVQTFIKELVLQL
jgi:predicted P-loop ATPase